jgi:glycosyltransferase involved in cell wall biosynthesis
MKILTVQRNFPPCRIVGSLTHARMLAFELSRRGHEVHALIERKCSTSSIQTFGKYSWRGIMIHRDVPTINWIAIPSYIMLVPKYIKKLEEHYEFDVIHTHTVSGNFLAFHKPKAPTILTVHGVYRDLTDALRKYGHLNQSPCILSWLRNYLGKELYSRLEAKSCKKADAIICLTPKEKNSVIEKYGVKTSGKISVIPNGINIREIRDRAAENKVAFEFERPVLLFCGRFSPIKGILHLLRSWRIVRSHGVNGTLLLVGRSDLLLGAIKEYVERAKLNIHIIQDVSYDRLIALYKESDIFLLPSLFEGLPYTLIDALSLGKPAVVSTLLGFKSLLRDSVLYANPIDPHDFAEKIEILIKDSGLRKELGKRAEVKAKKIFNLDGVVDRIIQLYEHVIHK